MDARRTQLETVLILKEGQIVVCSSRILGLVAELDNASHAVLEQWRKKKLLRGILRDYDMTVETIMSFPLTYGEVFSKFTVHEFRLRMTKPTLSLALVVNVEHGQKSWECVFDESLKKLLTTADWKRQAEEGSKMWQEEGSLSAKKLDTLLNTVQKKVGMVTQVLVMQVRQWEWFSIADWRFLL